MSYLGGINGSGQAGWFSNGGTVKNCVVLLKDLKSKNEQDYLNDIGNFSDHSNNKVLSYNNSLSSKSSTYINLGWDFNNIWIINNSYPLLKSFRSNYIYTYDGKRTSFTDDDALNFIGFFLNSKEIKQSENITIVRNSDMYKLLTGTYSGEDLVEKSIACSGYIKVAIGKYADKYNSLSNDFRNNIIMYLEKHVPKQGIGIAEEIIGEYNSKAKNKLSEAIIDLGMEIVGISEAVGGMYINVSLDMIKGIKSKVGSAREYVDYACAAIYEIFLSKTNELAGRYGYFGDYLDLRSSGSPDEEYMKPQFALLRTSYSNNHWWASLMDLLTFLTGKESFIQNFDTLDRWAEQVYLMSTIKINPVFCTHQYELIKYVAATCDLNGSRLYSCTKCFDTYVEEIPLQQHSYIPYISDKPTCTKVGREEYRCCNCGDSFTKAILAMGHNIKVMENEDWYTYKCQNCDYSEEKPKEHIHSYLTTVVPATCDSFGYTINRCDGCLDEFVSDYVATLNHEYYCDDVIEEPTCQQEGKTIYKCSICDDSYEKSLPKVTHKYLEHTHLATCITPGEKIYTCVYCQDEKKEELSDKLNHTYLDYTNYTENCITYVSATCSKCHNTNMVNSIVLMHNWSDRLIIDEVPTKNSIGNASYHCLNENCALTKDIKEIPYLIISGTTLTLYDDISVNYMVNKSLFDGTAYTAPYMEFEFGGVKTVVTDYTEEGEYYKFSFNNISPNKMKDTIKSTLYAYVGETLLSSETKEYSISEYCYSMLAEYSGDDYANLRTLLVDLLNYGADTQIYTGYKINQLVNADLTEAQKAFASGDLETLTDALNTKYKTIESPAVKWCGAELELNSAITMKLMIETADVNDLSVVISGDSGLIENIPSSSFVYYTGEKYYIYFNGLDASQMSDNIYLTVYKNGVAVSNTVRYSIESYACAMQSGSNIRLKNLVNSMMKYGKSANLYKNKGVN